MFKTYLPNITNEHSPYFGLAYANPPESDILLLKADWFYDWTCVVKRINENIQSVPMCCQGLSKKAGSDYYGYMLVFNEPNIAVQSNLTPDQGLSNFQAIKEFYQYANFVIGNVSIGATDWLRRFNETTPIPRIGIHCYLEEWVTMSYIDKTLDQLHKDIPVPIWVTEFNNLRDDAEEFGELLDLLISKPYIERISPFTNRQYGEWWGLKHCDLYSDTGPTEKGKRYIDRSVLDNSSRSSRLSSCKRTI